jgi:hypothetical protein
MDSDAIQPPDFAGQVLNGLIPSSVGFAIFDRWFRYESISNALAVIHGVPVQDHFGESIRKMAGEVALTVPVLDAVFEAGKVISSFEIIGSLPCRPGLRETLYPLGQPEKAIGERSQIEPWLTLYNHLLVCVRNQERRYDG